MTDRNKDLDLSIAIALTIRFQHEQTTKPNLTFKGYLQQLKRKGIKKPIRARNRNRRPKPRKDGSPPLQRTIPATEAQEAVFKKMNLILDPSLDTTKVPETGAVNISLSGHEVFTSLGYLQNLIERSFSHKSSYVAIRRLLKQLVRVEIRWSDKQLSKDGVTRPFRSCIRCIMKLSKLNVPSFREEVATRIIKLVLKFVKSHSSSEFTHNKFLELIQTSEEAIAVNFPEMLMQTQSRSAQKSYMMYVQNWKSSRKAVFKKSPLIGVSLDVVLPVLLRLIRYLYNSIDEELTWKHRYKIENKRRQLLAFLILNGDPTPIKVFKRIEFPSIPE
ncbi:unnamed protein product [Ambrosiozyma monospora]|uniref:Unnamed protein product n=1 Tax=Ambrosiozyma monospora TaxID=43982 RepID=A0ACB5SW24_AMBMO|nr:unnamed protein product [Ambrosiozyma monospora]